MERTGHRDTRSLQQYERPTVATKVEISKAFVLTLADNVTGKGPSEVKRPSEVKPRSEMKGLSEENGVKDVKLEEKGTKFSNCIFYIRILTLEFILFEVGV